MFNAYSVIPGDRILLLGEGNFSFSKDFVVLNEGILYDGQVEVVSTCQENYLDTHFETKNQTLNFLKEKGVSIIFNVDATKLKYHSSICNKTFTKIIFNFPHVGGKMKIHLNRKLLRDFFTSTCDVLQDGGCVVVALCDGQGGTQADCKQRRWDDCWQITEAAGLSDYVLTDVQVFEPSCFPNYVNVGYRSMEKSFYSNHAIVHIFKKQDPPPILLRNYENLSDSDVMNDDLIYEFLDDNLSNPLFNTQSASSYLIDLVKEKLGNDYHMHKSILTYYSPSTKKVSRNGNVISTIDPKSILNLIEIVKKDTINFNAFLVRVIMRKTPIDLKAFHDAPAKCQLLLYGNFTSASAIYEYLTEMFKAFNSDWLLNMVDVDDEISKSIIYASSNSVHKQIDIVHSFLSMNETWCHIVHTDELAQILFKLQEWRMLWEGRVEQCMSSVPKFRPTSLYPKSYCFDMSLSVPLHLNDTFEDRLYRVLWLMAGDMIVDAYRLSTYLPTDRPLACYCYRITYKSYKAPLHRKRVIYIHEQIITKLITKIVVG